MHRNINTNIALHYNHTEYNTTPRPYCTDIMLRILRKFHFSIIYKVKEGHKFGGGGCKTKTTSSYVFELLFRFLENHAYTIEASCHTDWWEGGNIIRAKNAWGIYNSYCSDTYTNVRKYTDNWDIFNWARHRRAKREKLNIVIKICVWLL